MPASLYSSPDVWWNFAFSPIPSLYPWALPARVVTWPIQVGWMILHQYSVVLAQRFSYSCFGQRRKSVLDNAEWIMGNGGLRLRDTEWHGTNTRVMLSPSWNTVNVNQGTPTIATHNTDRHCWVRLCRATFVETAVYAPIPRPTNPPATQAILRLSMLIR